MPWLNLGFLFRLVVLQPLFNFLILLYRLLPGHDLGVAVLLLTVAIKALLWPLNRQAFLNQKKMGRVQARLKELQGKYKDRPAEQAQQMNELFRQEKINPWSSLWPVVVQLPILLALYQIFSREVWQINAGLLYPFVPTTSRVNPLFLGLLDLSQPNALLAFLAALLQFWQTRTAEKLMKQGQPQPAGGSLNASALLQKEMLFLFPALTFFILLKFPSVLGLYWTAISFLATIEQHLFQKYTADHDALTRSADRR